MKKIKQLLSDKKGAGMLLCMGLTLVILLISIPIYSFTESSIRIAHIKETVQNSIDVYTIKTGKEVMQSVKCGHDYTKSLNKECFLSDLQKQLNLRNRFKGYDNKDNFIYELDNVNMKFTANNTLKVEVTYTIVYQYYFMSKSLFQTNIEVEQESRYNLK